jgi:hypothetical protein
MRAWLFVLAACSSKSPEPAAESGESFGSLPDKLVARIAEPARRGPAFGVEAKPLPAADQPGPAYLWVDNVGLATIAVDGTVSIQANTTPNVTAIALDGDGSLFVAVRDQVSRLRDGQLVPIPGKSPIQIFDLRVAPDGGLWAAYLDQLVRYTGSAWKAEQSGLGSHVRGITFDGAGRTFVAGDKLVVFENGGWKVVLDTSGIDVEKDKLPGWTEAIATPDGLVVLGCTYRVDIAKGKATAYYLNGGGIKHARLVGKELVGHNCFYGGLSRAPGADKVIELNKESKLNKGEQAVDGRGRVWVYDRERGFEITGLDGKVTKLPNGSIPELTGEVIALAVAGTGPDTLPGAREIARGRITGRIATAGKPAAGVSVEICRDPWRTYSKKSSPCSSKPDRLTATTDASGAFTIEAPLALYSIAAQVAGTWYGLPWLDTACKSMAAGAECNVGQLDTATAKQD